MVAINGGTGEGERMGDGGGPLRRGGPGPAGRGGGGATRLEASVVLGAVNIADVAARMLSVRLERASNGELVGLCPMHPDTNPSFRVNVRKQRWFCNSQCGGGDAIALVQKVLGLEFRPALERLAVFAGLVVPGDGGGELRPDPARAD